MDQEAHNSTVSLESGQADYQIEANNLLFGYIYVLLSLTTTCILQFASGSTGEIKLVLKGSNPNRPAYDRSR